MSLTERCSLRPCLCCAVSAISVHLCRFLDTFYDASSIFYRDSRLPPRGELRHILMELDADGDGMLSFEEMRGIISGKAQLPPAEG